jgi:hypothetical protein
MTLGRVRSWLSGRFSGLCARPYGTVGATPRRGYPLARLLTEKRARPAYGHSQQEVSNRNDNR